MDLDRNNIERLEEISRKVADNDVEAIRRMIDPSRGAFRPADLVTTPATIQAVTGWLQAPAIPSGSNETSVKPQCVIWSQTNGCVAVGRYSQFKQGYSQQLIGTSASTPANYTPFQTVGDMWWAALGSIVVAPTSASGQYLSDDLYIPVDDNRNVRISPDISQAFNRGRVVGGYMTVVSDSTSTTSAALSGTFNAGYVCDTRDLPGFSPPKLMQNTVTRKDCIMNEKVQDGVYVCVGPNVKPDLEPINRILTDVQDDGAFALVWSGNLTSSNYQAFTNTGSNEISVQNVYGQSQWTPRLQTSQSFKGFYNQRNLGSSFTPDLVSAAVSQYLFGSGFADSGTGNTYAALTDSAFASGSMFFSPLFKTQPSSLMPTPIPSYPLPAIGLLDEPRFEFYVTKSVADLAALIGGQSFDNPGQGSTVTSTQYFTGIGNAAQGIVGSLQVTHLWAYEYLDPEDGLLKINLVTSDGGTEVISVDYVENELITPQSNGNKVMSCNPTGDTPTTAQSTGGSVVCKLSSTANRPTTQGVALYPRVAANINDPDPVLTQQRNLIYAGTVVSVLPCSRGTSLLDSVSATVGVTAVPSPGTGDEITTAVLPAQSQCFDVSLVAVKMFSPGMYKRGALEAAIVEWRSVAVGQTVNLQMEYYVQAQTTASIAPYSKTQKGNVNAVRMTNTRAINLLSMLYNSDDVKQLRRIWRKKDIDSDVKAFAADFDWNTLISIVEKNIDDPDLAGSLYDYMNSAGFFSKLIGGIRRGIGKAARFIENDALPIAKKALPLIEQALPYAHAMGASGCMGAEGMMGAGGMMGAEADYGSESDGDEYSSSDENMCADGMYGMFYPSDAARHGLKAVRVAVGDTLGPYSRSFWTAKQLLSYIRRYKLAGNSPVVGTHGYAAYQKLRVQRTRFSARDGLMRTSIKKETVVFAPYWNTFEKTNKRGVASLYRIPADNKNTLEAVRGAVEELKSILKTDTDVQIGQIDITKLPVTNKRGQVTEYYVMKIGGVEVARSPVVLAAFPKISVVPKEAKKEQAEFDKYYADRRAAKPEFKTEALRSFAPSRRGSVRGSEEATERTITPGVRTFTNGAGAYIQKTTANDGTVTYQLKNVGSRDYVPYNIPQGSLLPSMWVDSVSGLMDM